MSARLVHLQAKYAKPLWGQEIEMKPKTLKGRVSHHRQHPDEIASMWQASRFGKKIFPNFDEVPLILWDAGQPPPDGRPIHLWERDNFVVGTANSVADEHSLNREKRRVHCAATLTARLLGIQDDPALQEILAELVRNDRHGHRTVWDLESICWALYFDGVTELEVEKIMFEWFDSVYAAQQRKLKGEPAPLLIGRPSLNDYIREFIVAEYSYRGEDGDRDAARRAPSAYEAAKAFGVELWEEVSKILDLEDRQHTKGAATLLDIHSYVENMHALGFDEKHVRGRVFRLLLAKRQEQRMFMSALDEVHPNAASPTVSFVQLYRSKINPGEFVRLDVRAGLREEALKNMIINERHKLLWEIAVVQSDNIVAHKAVRHYYKTRLTIPGSDPAKPLSMEVRPHIILLRKPTRHVTVFLNAVPYQPVILRIRKEEYRRGSTPNVFISDSKLMQDGNIREEPLWCVSDGNQLLNSSLTAPGVPATRLSLERIIDCIIGGLRYLHLKSMEHLAVRPQHDRQRQNRRPKHNKDRNEAKFSKPAHKPVPETTAMAQALSKAGVRTPAASDMVDLPDDTINQIVDGLMESTREAHSAQPRVRKP
jgi:hypothetical protein